MRRGRPTAYAGTTGVVLPSVVVFFRTGTGASDSPDVGLSLHLP